MILENDSLLKINYDTITQNLWVKIPDLIGTPLAQFENSTQKLAHMVVFHDVKKLLVDLTSGVPGLDEEHYRIVVKHFLQTLSLSHLEKYARVIPESPAREYLISNFGKEMHEKLGLTFKARSFTNIAEACSWLQEP